MLHHKITLPKPPSVYTGCEKVLTHKKRTSAKCNGSNELTALQ